MNRLYVHENKGLHSS